MRPRDGISQKRRHGELSQASIEVVHGEILMVAKTPGGLISLLYVCMYVVRQLKASAGESPPVK